MTTQHGGPSGHVRSDTADAAYAKAARKRLVESRAKIDFARAEIEHAIATGSLKSSDKLACAQRAMETTLAVAESRLQSLEKTGEEGREALRDKLEDAWEDLSHSISKLVARIKDESA